MKYVGSVTDYSWIRSIFQLPPERRREFIGIGKSNWKLDEGLDFIYSLKRLPRVYLDEYNNRKDV